MSDTEKQFQAALRDVEYKFKREIENDTPERNAGETVAVMAGIGLGKSQFLREVIEQALQQQEQSR